MRACNTRRNKQHIVRSSRPSEISAVSCSVDKIAWPPYSIAMNLQQVRLRLTGGFRPFCLLTSDGHEYPVRHPEFVFIAPRAVVVVHESGYVVSLDPLHIVAIKEMPRKRNGASKS